MRTIFILMLSFLNQAVYAQSYSDKGTLAQKLLIIQDFKVILNADSIEHPETLEALKILTEKLTELTKIIPSTQLQIFRQTPIWVEWEMRENGAMEYHPSKDWLISHGYNVNKEKCIEISNIKNFIAWQKLNQPYMVLHEFAHSYCHQTLGLTNPDVLAAYRSALTSRKYESVDYNLGGKRKAYALNNADEYFAELTEAYFGENDYFPFNRIQLKNFDPIGYDLMLQTWGDN